MERKERLKKAFDYLLSQGIVHKQKDLASAIGSTGPNISKALKGDPKVLTDNFCRRIQENVKVISADWLISGHGDMIIKDSNNVATEQIPVPDYSSLMNATIAAKDETIASLKRELATKEELLHSLQQQVSDLSIALSIIKEKSLESYQFPIGVAEESNIAAVKKYSEISAKFPSTRK